MTQMQIFGFKSVHSFTQTETGLIKIRTSKRLNTWYTEHVTIGIAHVLHRHHVLTIEGSACGQEKVKWPCT